MVTINPADCKPGEVYEGTVDGDLCFLVRNDPVDERPWSGLHRNGCTEFYLSDDAVPDLVRLVPAREVTREDRGELWYLIRDELRGVYPSISDQDHRKLDLAASAAADTVVAHLNANGGLPASCEDAALADRLERQAATISELQGSFLRVERDADRWRRAHAIVEQERDQARSERDELQAKLDSLRVAYSNLDARANKMVERVAAAERERDEAAEACATPAVTRADIEKAIRSGMSRFAAALGEQCITEAVDAVHALVSGDDPAVYVVRESDIAAVEVERVDDQRNADGALMAWTGESAEEVRGQNANALRNLAHREAVARAIEAEQAVDPVEDAAVAAFKAEWHRADEEGDEGNRVRRGIRAARHVLGQEADQ